MTEPTEMGGFAAEQEPIVIVPDSTGFAAKLVEAHKGAMDEVAQLRDLARAPGKLALLSDINSIVQFHAIVKLLGELLTEAQVLTGSKAPIDDNPASIWIDEAGNYYQSIGIGDEVRTFSPDGEVYFPVGKSVPFNPNAEFGSGGVLLESAPKPLSEPRYVRRKGSEQLTIASGATHISIAVIAGEISCSNGDGVLTAGIPMSWRHSNGLSELIFNGDEDADYVVWFQCPMVEAVEVEPTLDPIEPITEEEVIPMTGDLLPEPNDLVLVSEGIAA